jgi:hypothetical protein
MISVKDLHNKSMEYAELAFIEKMKGNYDNSLNYFKKAFDAELSAVEEFEKTEKVEPTYSVLLRSAATLALDCDEPRKAEQFISKALANNPPDEIANELRDLFEQTNLKRHLKLRGISLEEDEMQMNLTGNSVGFGIVQSDEFLKRIDNASKMIYRIVERKQKKPFREKGRINKDLKENYEIFVSVPRAASFSITLKVGIPTDQKLLPGFQDTSQIVDEFMDLISLVNTNKINEIKDRINDNAYYRNFISLAKTIAPDGENIKQVGFTSIRNGKEKYSEITKPRNELPHLDDIDEKNAHKVTIKGSLKYADATHGESGIIKIIDEKNKSHKIKVPEGMMNDIVKPMWDSIVIIKGIKKRNSIELIDIQETE